MGIIGLWLLWLNKNVLEQVRRDQLAPVGRAAESRAKNEREMLRSIAVVFLLVLIVIFAH